MGKLQPPLLLVYIIHVYMYEHLLVSSTISWRMSPLTSCSKKCMGSGSWGRSSIGPGEPTNGGGEGDWSVPGVVVVHGSDE